MNSRQRYPHRGLWVNDQGVPMNVRYVRWAILGIILIGSMILNYLHITAGAAFPSVHAICPPGGLENLQIWLSGHANLQ